MNKKANFNGNETETKMENPALASGVTNLGFGAYKNRKLKIKL